MAKTPMNVRLDMLVDQETKDVLEAATQEYGMGSVAAMVRFCIRQTLRNEFKNHAKNKEHKGSTP